MNSKKKNTPVDSTKDIEEKKIAGIEINAVRMYSPKMKYYLPEIEMPASEFRSGYQGYIAERFTGMTDHYGLPVFEGDVIYQTLWLGQVESESWHYVCWDGNLGCFIARCCDRNGVPDCADPCDRNGYAPMSQDWTEQKTVIGNIHECHGVSRQSGFTVDSSHTPSCIPFDEIVADREICMDIKNEFPKEFNNSIFIWVYYPFTSKWIATFRKGSYTPHAIAFPAPLADEIIRCLPNEWYGVDEDDFMKRNGTNPGIVTGQTRFELQIEKNDLDEINSRYAIDDGHGTLAFQEMAPDTQKLSTGLLGAWFFMMRNRKME